MNETLVIVADLGRLKAYKFGSTVRGTPRLELSEQFALEEGHRRVRDEVTDSAGRRGVPTQGNRGAPLADAHNLELETERRMVKEIGRHIERLARNHPGLGIHFAAHKEINRAVIEALPRPVRERLQSNLSLDLTKASKEELIGYFVARIPYEPAQRGLGTAGMLFNHGRGAASPARPPAAGI